MAEAARSKQALRQGIYRDFARLQLISEDDYKKIFISPKMISSIRTRVRDSINTPPRAFPNITPKKVHKIKIWALAKSAGSI